MTDHYLKTELYERISQDPSLFEWLEAGSLDGVWYLNVENFTDEWYSPRFKALFGYEDYEIPNTSQWWQENIFPEDLERALESYRKHVENPEQHPYDQIVRYRHKDGSTVWVRCRGLVLTEKGNPVRMLGAHTDITPIKRAELDAARRIAELEALSMALQRSNHELEQFAYLASHDLQEPLRMVASFAKMIDATYGETGEPLDDRGRKWLGYLVEGASRMQTLINSLLSLSRIKEQAEEMAPIEMEQIMQEIVTDLAVRITEKNAKILTGNLPAFMGVHSQVRQVFQNLISNALKFHGEKPPVVRIRGDELDNGMVRYTIQDDGVGIRSHDVGKIFEAFYRGKGTQDISGSGIGLSICKKIVTLHGGTIRCESEPDVGTTFIVTFKGTRK